MSFNPRSRTGNDTAQGQWANNILTFQSTFPHGERPIRIEKIDETTGFQSTFPHGERRRVEEGSGHNGTVSIHVPARGTTKKSYKGDYDKLRFNPRSRTGNDHGLIALIKPVKLCFNPRSRTGNDQGEKDYHGLLPGFQSTFPHGERPDRRRRNGESGSFNPRSRTGNDEKGFIKYCPYCGFNPRSRTGNDLVQTSLPLKQSRKFQSTFPHGERLER